MRGDKSTQVSWKRPGRASHQRGVRTAAVMVAVTALLIGALAATLLATLRSDPDGESEPEAAAGQKSGGSGAVELPTGSDVVEGYPVGFGRDELGAVAVPVELNLAQIGFDYDQATAVARVYTATGDRDAVVARAREAVATRRRDLGLPLRGPVAAPAAFALTPYAVEVAALDAGRQRYLVTVLSLASTTNAAGKVSTRYYTGAQIVAWAGDWKVVEPTGADQQQLAALVRRSNAPDPVGPENLPRLRAAGWTPIATPLTGHGATS